MVVATGRAAATPGQELAQANQAFRAGQFTIAQPIYNNLLYPTPRLASKDDLADAYVALGVCRLENGDLPGARGEFEKALSTDPNHQLDRTVITNKEAIRMFDDKKIEIARRTTDEAAKKKQADLEKAIRDYRDSAHVIEAHPYYLNFVPFGSGQFQNHQNIKGVLFAGGEALTGFTSIGIWGYLINKYGITNQHLRVDTNEAANIRFLQQVEIVSGVAFIGLYIYGVVDARLHWKPTSRGEFDDSLLPPELRKQLKAPKKTTLLDRVHLEPIVTPTGVGLGLGWEN